MSIHSGGESCSDLGSSARSQRPSYEVSRVLGKQWIDSAKDGNLGTMKAMISRDPLLLHFRATVRARQIPLATSPNAFEPSFLDLNGIL